MNKATKFYLITIGVFIVIIIMVIIALFSRSKPVKDISDVIKVKDELIQVYAKQREEDRLKIDDLNQQLQIKDSLLQTKEKTIIREINKIPVYINSLNKDSLRAAGERD